MERLTVDIEERRDKAFSEWLLAHHDEFSGRMGLAGHLYKAYADGYMAGVDQTQHDYAAHCASQHDAEN